MSQKDQITGHGVRAAFVVVLDHDRECVGAERRTAAEHKPKPRLVERAGCLRQPIDVAPIAATTTDQNDCLGLLLTHELDDLQFAVRIAVARTNQTQPSLGRGLLLDALADIRERKTDQVVDDERHSLGTPTPERTRLNIDHIVELTNGLHHPHTNLRRNQIIAGQHPKNHNNKNTRQNNNILNHQPFARGRLSRHHNPFQKKTKTDQQ